MTSPPNNRFTYPIGDFFFFPSPGVFTSSHRDATSLRLESLTPRVSERMLHERPLQSLCARSRGTLVAIPRPPDFDWTAAVLGELARDDHALGAVAVVALPHCHWCDGSTLDLVRIGEACRALRVPLVCDITQSAGVMPFDVNEVCPAFVACSVHKWLHGAYGCSLAYAAPGFLDLSGARRVVGGGGTDARHVATLENFERQLAGSDSPRWDEAGEAFSAEGYAGQNWQDARVLDGGGRPNPVTIPVLLDALRTVVREWTPERTAAYSAALTGRIAAAARDVGFLVPNTHAPHIVGIRVPTASVGRGLAPARAPSAAAVERATALARGMRADGVVVSVRSGAVRVSVGTYTTEREVERLVASLQKHARHLCPRPRM